ncbi:MAG: YhdH/YhfP family quinone oxidoreductase [Deltaproteobacteria bacterium]
MGNINFRAMVVEEVEKEKFTRTVKEKSTGELPKGDALIRVHYSSLNYKDGLSASGNRGVTKTYPHTPGIDAAGVVEECASGKFTPGDRVIVTGFELGSSVSGGFGQFIKVPSEWAARLPENLSLRESMIYGTAGLTAALCVEKLLKNGVKPEQGEVLVTGATGGVGSIAIGILAKLGFAVAAVTGKPEEKQWLTELGAREIIGREEAKDSSGRPLLRGRWAGVVDTVGGDILATAVKATKYDGTVSCCGNAASGDLNLNVYPFILRGVTLVGVDSANRPVAEKSATWERIAAIWKIDSLEKIAKEVSLDELSAEIDLIVQGKQRGRVVVNLNR